MSILKNIPEQYRGWAYLALFIVLVVLMATLVIIDVVRGGDAAGWVPYLFGGLGLAGTGLAATNTRRGK